MNCPAGIMQGLHKFLLFHVLTCLGQNGHGSEIINGEKVPENSMLYMVSVQNHQGHVCGGFLVSDQFVLTSAHCKNENPNLVVLGTHNSKDLENTQYIEEKYTIKTHPNGEVGDDIMLLKLSRKVQLHDRIQTIQLPESDINVKENAQCRVAGWGKTSTNGGDVDELRMVDVSVIDPQVCKKKWPNLPPNVICAGGYGTNKGVCQGDSGGPLVCNGVAVGVASFNQKFNCDHPDAPNIYTDISKHIHWIKQLINKRKS